MEKYRRKKICKSSFFQTVHVDFSLKEKPEKQASVIWKINCIGKKGDGFAQEWYKKLSHLDKLWFLRCSRILFEENVGLEQHVSHRFQENNTSNVFYNPSNIVHFSAKSDILQAQHKRKFRFSFSFWMGSASLGTFVWQGLNPCWHFTISPNTYNNPSC